jgi:3-hydroxybutyryl-CoA dehydrogenase
MVERIGVVGSGTMGGGIAQVAARFGFSVKICDVGREFLERALARIESGLRRDVERGRLSEDQMSRSLSRVSATTSLEDLKDSDFVIEAVTESYEVKSAVFRQLDAILSPEAILATNTSSISITRLAAATSRADRFIGMHFMNPVPAMKLVEIIRGAATSDQTLSATRDLARAMGKVPIEVNDSPGFVSNRVLMPMINEAIFALYEGVGSPEAIDQIMKLGMNHPMGPLELADLIGLDVCLAIMNVLYEEFGDPKYRPCPLLRKYVDAGWLGRKSGRGFYRY